VEVWELMEVAEQQNYPFAWMNVDTFPEQVQQLAVWNTLMTKLLEQMMVLLMLEQMMFVKTGVALGRQEQVHGQTKLNLYQ
jgi:hypothetical protein